jgi:isoaspartyl peptidase/L-asparaginase-like protein (Ntn-hydrolase superfamily)
MELDACFMDVCSRACGAVAGVSGYLPIRVARRLMDEDLHVLLTGKGAERFAEECCIPPELTLSDYQKQQWLEDVAPILLEQKRGNWGSGSNGTESQFGA